MARVAPSGALEKGKLKLHQCKSGRTLEYAIQGRCNDDDPFLLHLMGMHMAGMGPPHLTMGAARKPHIKKQEDWDKVPFKVILPSRAGYGRSTPPPDVKTWTYGLMAADMADLCDALGAGKVALLGVSSGGPNCLAFAAHYPERAAAVFTISGDASYGPSQPKAAKKFGAPFSEESPQYAEGMPACRTGCCAPCCHGPCRCPCCCSLGGAADYKIESRDADFRLEDVQCPAIVLHGTKDDMVDVNCAHYIAMKVPKARKVIVDGMGHGECEGSTFDRHLGDLRRLARGEPLQEVMLGAR